MDYALRAEPGAIEIHGGEARGILGAEYTGREIDVGKGYALAKQWLESHETSRECPLDIETRFLTSLASATEGTLESPWFRGRFFREPPNSVFDFGPPPAERTRQGRYNKEGHPFSTSVHRRAVGSESSAPQDRESRSGSSGSVYRPSSRSSM
jgi:hypothetical protein